MNPDNAQSAGQTPGVSDIDTNPQPPKPDPIQERINELTRNLYEERRAREAQQAQFNELMAAQIRANQQPKEEQPVVPDIQLPEGIDPALAAILKQQNEHFRNALEAANKRAEMVAQQYARGAQQTAEQIALQQAVVGQPKQVADLAIQLFNNWRQNGKTGWEPVDAVTFARGQLGIAGNSQPVVHRANPNDLNIGSGGVPNPRQTNNQLEAPLPDDVLRKMKPAALEQYWASRLEKQGGIDQPILRRDERED